MKKIGLLPSGKLMFLIINSIIYWSFYYLFIMFSPTVCNKLCAYDPKTGRSGDCCALDVQMHPTRQFQYTFLPILFLFIVSLILLLIVKNRLLLIFLTISTYIGFFLVTMIFGVRW